MVKNFAFHIRPAQVGDICVLLESVDDAEATHLYHYQQTLQARFGGKAVVPVHLTCHRLEIQGDAQLATLHEALGQVLSTVSPFALTALSLQTLYVPVLGTCMLKWRVDVTDELRHFSYLVRDAVSRVGATSLYAPDAVSSLVTALQGVGDLSSEALEIPNMFPHHLFTAAKVELSRIEGPNDFASLATLEF